ncbi:Haloacid dehalogenase-like hydrolase-domain-containing protein [Talaromyces proteolyticus]|uniref:Haloacid dehalogenase-like hydrolase-domain-containing protein n=1 Tax=Talaromyces proteolyticus TaxID=1131652 RepID=A0AAD4KY39_9EURO|nr:Haloacid dehalogenase-like hydrolase-domain-containing protein [Talaromyces proteolyticus]KAH8701943.1 Haloacid dehalogenase-like hydrolase-domain-containing protein [Talaromyces proteolyticus]
MPQSHLQHSIQSTARYTHYYIVPSTFNMPPKKHVVFDVVGTCVSFDAFYSRINLILGPRLRHHNITAQLFGYTWMEAAELDFTFLSISERYQPYKHVLKALFYRTLWMAGVPDPRSFATDAERDQCIAGYSDLQLRPGAKECFEKLRGDGFTVWCFTTGDVARVRGYFENGGVDVPMENFVSCDSRGVAKPALEAYRSVLERFEEGDEKWFAAAHMWDVSAARMVGFKGAYCSVYEMESCKEIFGEMDVMAESLVEMAENISRMYKDT